MWTFQMWLARKAKKIHLLCSVLLIAIILLALSILQLADLLSLQRQNFKLQGLPIDKVHQIQELQTEKPEFFKRDMGGSRANYSSVEADELIKMLKRFFNQTDLQLGHVFNESQDYFLFLRQLNKHAPKKGPHLKKYLRTNSSTSFVRFYKEINQHFLYRPEDNSSLYDLLKDLNNVPIKSTEELSGENNLKLILNFHNGGTGIFTPKRWVDRELNPDHFFKMDIISHRAEIAAFHLDRVLGFHKVPPTVGRILNITSDVMLLAKGRLKEHFFQSEEGSICIQGDCSPHCADTCGAPELLEGSTSVALPDINTCPRKRDRHPIKLLLAKIKKMKFDKTYRYCRDNVKTRRLQQAAPTHLLEVVEMSIFDFLIDNMDRRLIERFKQFGDNGFLLHDDNGRGFAKAKRDCSTCLTPLQQCCMIRLSTLLKLVKLYLGPSSLSQVMRNSLKDDPLAPVLLDTHLNSLDRRLGKILKVVKRCLNGVKFWKNVLIDDFIPLK
ncbi:extracellular serine/threonine protein kinase FAM20C [Biomphalaria glabrata]|nr:extracellular serine/threonine protein kinase FAM20C [Biomphalaria glabrata]